MPMTVIWGLEIDFAASTCRKDDRANKKENTKSNNVEPIAANTGKAKSELLISFVGVFCIAN